jgi:hypothetical protein
VSFSGTADPAAEKHCNMNHKLEKAINNNHSLYQAIFSHYHIELRIKDNVAYTENQVPPLYSNIVTRSEEWRPDDHFRKIERNYEDEKWSEWSIKDSFRVLDLSKDGFGKLFDAQWIYLERNNFNPIKPNHFQYQTIQSEEGLLSWRLAWNRDAALGQKIFNAKLLNDSNIYFLAGYDRGKLVSGCLVNETDDVLGISNVFAPDRGIVHWSGIVSFLLTLFTDKDIVGYELEKLVAELAPLGIEAIGNLSIWLKTR